MSLKRVPYVFLIVVILLVGFVPTAAASAVAPQPAQQPVQADWSVYDGYILCALNDQYPPIGCLYEHEAAEEEDGAGTLKASGEIYRNSGDDQLNEHVDIVIDEAVVFSSRDYAGSPTYEDFEFEVELEAGEHEVVVRHGDATADPSSPGSVGITLELEFEEATPTPTPTATPVPEARCVSCGADSNQVEIGESTTIHIVGENTDAWELHIDGQKVAEGPGPEGEHVFTAEEAGTYGFQAWTRNAYTGDWVTDEVACSSEVTVEKPEPELGAIAGCVDEPGDSLKAIGPEPKTDVYYSPSAKQAGEVVSIGDLTSGLYRVSAPNHGPIELWVYPGKTARAPWPCDSWTLQLENNSSSAVTKIVIEHVDDVAVGSIYSKTAELAEELGWTGQSCPILDDDYTPDPWATSFWFFQMTGKSYDVPGRGFVFEIDEGGTYKRQFGSLAEFAGYGRKDLEGPIGGLFALIEDKGPAHQIRSAYQAHWAMIFGPGGERGSKNMRPDLTAKENSIEVAQLDAGAEGFRRWLVALGMEVGKPVDDPEMVRESCYLAARDGWNHWLVDTSTVYEGPYGTWHPMVTTDQVVVPGLACGFWGCYYKGWEFAFDQEQTHALYSDGQGNLYITEKERLALIKAAPWPKQDGERLIIEEADFHGFLVTLAKALYENGQGRYVVRVPEEYQEEVGFAGSGYDSAYLARLAEAAEAVEAKVVEAETNRANWIAKHPGETVPEGLSEEGVVATRQAAEEARTLYESEAARFGF